MVLFNVARVDGAFQNNDPMVAEQMAIAGMKDVKLLRLVCETEEDIIRKAQQADVIVTHFAGMTDKVLSALPRLKAVVRYGVGYDCVDVEAATRNGILVVNVPDFCFEEVSNHVMMFLLAYCKKIALLNALTKEGCWEKAKMSLEPMRCLHGETLGIIGCGNNGRHTARKAKALNMRVIGYDKYLPKGIGEAAGIEMVSLQEVYQQADYISLHVALTDETHHLIDLDAFRQMRKNCVIINTSRGPVIKEADLIRALESGMIEGACLDVFEREPVDPKNPLLQMEQVLVTPHDASYSDEAFLLLKNAVMEEALRIKNREQPRNVVNKDVLKRNNLRLYADQTKGSEENYEEAGLRLYASSYGGRK